MKRFLFVFCSVFCLTYTNSAYAEGNFLINHFIRVQIESFGKKLTDQISANYTKEMAKENGDITFYSKRTFQQQKRIDNFKENVKRKRADFIRFTEFTPKGDAIITEYQFNGKLIYYRSDTSRDRTDIYRKGRFVNGTFIKGPHVIEDYCTKLVDDPKMPYITNCYNELMHEF
jgi:Domain of unknown function (DUF4362)